MTGTLFFSVRVTKLNYTILTKTAVALAWWTPQIGVITAIQVIFFNIFLVFVQLHLLIIFLTYITIIKEDKNCLTTDLFSVI